MSGTDYRTRYYQGHTSAPRDPDLEPDARAVGRAPAALSLPVDRLPVGGEGDADHRAQGARDQRPPVARDREVHGDATPGAPREGARGCGDARLGPGARRAPRRPS